jgi:hypothetical protein
MNKSLALVISLALIMGTLSDCFSFKEYDKRLGKCYPHFSVQICFTFKGLFWKCYMRDDNARHVATDYYESMRGAIEHAMAEWSSKYPECYAEEELKRLRPHDEACQPIYINNICVMCCP